MCLTSYRINKAPSRHPWTTTHSFYALMGGFALDARNIEPNIFQNNRRRMVLSPGGLRFLIDHEPSLLPDLSRAEIQDKSKANNLAKTIVCVQAIWFCIQCFTRWGIRLSTSLLEINTFAHCICALIIFILWWNKPLDVDEPTLISASHKLELTSLMVLCSDARQQHKASSIKRPHAILRALIGAPSNAVSDNKVTLKQGQVYRGFEFIGFCARHPRTVVKNIQNTVPGDLTLDEDDMRRWELAEKALLEYRADVRSFLMNCNERMLVDRVGDVPKISKVSRGAMFATFAFAGFLYGGVHLIAWNNAFRSSTEAYFWKISAVILVSSGPLALPFIFAEGLWRSRTGTLKGIYAGAILILIPISSIVYVACRVYLVVESFWNLTHLEESTFVVPKWSQYFPHIT